jgi:hypothetical protein
MLRKIVIIMVSFMLVFSIAACKGTGKKVGTSIDKGVDKTGKFFKKTGKKVKKALE